MKIQSASEWQRLPIDQRLNIGRKLLLLRHGCVVDQHRNDGNLTFERRSDFQPNKVVRIIYSTGSVRLFAEPATSDYRDNRICARNGVVDLRAKIHSWPDGINIHKNILRTKFRLQPVIEATSNG